MSNELNEIPTHSDCDEEWILKELQKHGLDHYQLPQLSIGLVIKLFQRMERMEAALQRIEEKLDE